jgi:phosphatidylglycerol:prolipoprotein diacylglycerol transferase
VHPTQLYEIASALVMFAILWKLSDRPLRPWQLFGAYLGLYGIERFLIEFVRAKSDRIALGLSTSQIASLVVLGIGVYLWTRRSGTPSAPAARTSTASRPAASAAGKGRR